MNFINDGIETVPCSSEDPEELACAVGEFGIAKVIVRWPEKLLAVIRTECVKLLDFPPKRAEGLNYGNGSGYRLLREQAAETCPATAEFFGQEWMREVASRLLESGYLFNHDIIVVRDLVSTVHAARTPHYDRTPNLKYFLYLSEVTEDNGPFTCFIGTQKFGKRAQMENRLQMRLPTQSATRVLPPELTRIPVPVTGPAGTLMVIDSDIVHCGAPVRNGDRLAVRSRSYLPAYLP